MHHLSKYKKNEELRIQSKCWDPLCHVVCRVIGTIGFGRLPLSRSLTPRSAMAQQQPPLSRRQSPPITVEACQLTSFWDRIAMQKAPKSYKRGRSYANDCGAK